MLLIPEPLLTEIILHFQKSINYSVLYQIKIFSQM